MEALRDALNAASLEAYLDLHDILPGEPWRERLGKLIEAADTVVFALSPDSVAFDIVDWEVNEAERLGKRIPASCAPRCRPGSRTRAYQASQLHFHSQRGGAGKRACATRRSGSDRYNWIRTHTRIGELAADWDRNKRATEFLLRGAALVAAESWISELPPVGSAPTLLHREYIQASRAEALAQAVRAGRTQVLVGLLIVALISGAGYLVWLNRSSLQFQTNLILDTYMPTALWAPTEREPTPGRTFQECASCPRMIVVAAGEFLMGSPSAEGTVSERPQHNVRIEQPLAVGKFGVTFNQWDACVAHGGCAYHPDDRGWGRGLIPVTDVSWDDAQQYVTWLSKQTGRSYRLLSEAEREYAARGGSKTKYPWGDELGQGNANCPNGGSQWEEKHRRRSVHFPRMRSASTIWSATSGNGSKTTGIPTMAALR